MLQIINLTKIIGPKKIFENISFNLADNQKCAVIGRNGIGKSTIFNIICNLDKDYSGNITKSKNLVVIKTNQEFKLDETITPLDFILDSIPRYRELHKIIKDYENDPKHDSEEIEKFSDAIQMFHDLNLHNVENEILVKLEGFDISFEQALSPMITMSGGEKRFVDLVRVLMSHSDLILFDEPTNDMDYVGKGVFIEWLRNFKKSCAIITHDRDILMEVDKIIELSKYEAKEYYGNYSDYLKQNSTNTVTAIKKYESELDLLAEYKRKRDYFYSRKAYGGNDKVQYEKYKILYDDLYRTVEKPDFWIDQNTIQSQSKVVVEKYESYKSKNIEIRGKSETRFKGNIELISLIDLSIGYDKPLVENVNAKLFIGDHIEIRGRNGAGKSTIIKAILSMYSGNHPKTILAGKILINSNLRIGIYQQEVDKTLFDKTIAEVIGSYHTLFGMEFNDEIIKQVLSTYLFDPILDRDLLVRDCSGGQKARLQIIKMLINQPDVIILDEPTNHLDLPSIEELENMIRNFKGAVIYVSHDEVFRKFMGGKTIQV